LDLSGAGEVLAELLVVLDRGGPMSPILQPQSLEAYTRALVTMRAVAEALRDLPDPDGAIGDLAERIDAERKWVLAGIALGHEPSRPPDWLRRPHALTP
jgi:hypothetical protein